MIQKKRFKLKFSEFLVCSYHFLICMKTAILVSNQAREGYFPISIKSTSRPYLYRENSRRTDVRLETILCTNKIISSVIKNNTRCSAIIVDNSEHFLFDNLQR